MILEKDIINEIDALEKELLMIVSECERLKRHAPEGGSLRATKHGKTYQYFIRTPETGSNGEYIKKKDRKTALAHMAFAKRDLINPHHLSDEAYINKWKNQSYTGLDFDDRAHEYYTRQGLRVRSKSEILIADILDDLSIPFLYEKPLHLNSDTFHPDFTLLNIRQRKEMYWEHKVIRKMAKELKTKLGY